MFLHNSSQQDITDSWYYKIIFASLYLPEDTVLLYLSDSSSSSSKKRKMKMKDNFIICCRRLLEQSDQLYPSIPLRTRWWIIHPLITPWRLSKIQLLGKPVICYSLVLRPKSYRILLWLCPAQRGLRKNWRRKQTRSSNGRSQMKERTPLESNECIRLRWMNILCNFCSTEHPHPGC